ncbi:MAG: ribbon-helix-helix protein, CopG family [Pseudomonadota bacterium]
MATGKTSTLTFRIEPALKEALRAAAAREHRSIANMVEVLIRDWCSRNGIAIPEQGALFQEAPAAGAARERSK